MTTLVEQVEEHIQWAAGREGRLEVVRAVTRASARIAAGKQNTDAARAELHICVAHSICKVGSNIVLVLAVACGEHLRRRILAKELLDRVEEAVPACISDCDERRRHARCHANSILQVEVLQANEMIWPIDGTERETHSLYTRLSSALRVLATVDALGVEARRRAEVGSELLQERAKVRILAELTDVRSYA